ncbi:hypothetical protein A0128_06975 [Leptospira tipperaryensis]|uniref:Transposase n=1 Tax=Leptospira tipperaryensis TaxID=2564040 RepID=A0A1D7V2A2_9LEPT|nr:hypothetical protein A0128_06975 [Leptospira tipperaryensis]
MTSGKSQSPLCLELGIANVSIGRWKKEFDLESPGNEDLKSAVDKRIQALVKEVSHLKEQRDINLIPRNLTNLGL